MFLILLNGDWGLGIGDWGLGPIPNPQSPIPKNNINIIIFKIFIHINNLNKIIKNILLIQNFIFILIINLNIIII